MTGLPTVQVLLDDGTGTFPHDVTAYVRLLDGFNFNRGREDEQSSVTAGALSLTLNNADGRFTPGSTTIDSPSPITVDQRIRVKETVNGTTFNRFTGYVKSWRVTWPGAVDTFSVVQITATDAQARAERRILRSVVEEEILADSPAAYYTLGSPEGATTVADSSGNQAPALTMAGTGTDVVFGTATGPGTDGLTAAEFAGGKYLLATLSAVPTVIEGSFATTATDGRLFGNQNVGLGVLSGELAYVSNNQGDLTTLGVTVNDGLVHTYAYAANQVTIDGVTYTPGCAAPATTTYGIGAHIESGPVIGVLTGSMAHVAFYGSALSAARRTAHANAVLTGWDPADTVADVVAQVLEWVGLSVTAVGTFATIPEFADITGKTDMGLVQELVGDAEGGLIYADGSGDFVLYSRNDAPEKTTPDLSIAAEFVHFDAAPTDDDAEILNYLETTAEGTGVAQVVRDTASEGRHGRYSESKTYLVQTDEEALARANWLVGVNAEPTTRFGTLTVNLFGMTAAQQEAVVDGLEPGAWLRITDMPSQTPGGTTVDVMVQGFTEEQSASSWSLSCNVVARELFEAWILGDSTFGVLDSTTRLYV